MFLMGIFSMTYANYVLEKRIIEVLRSWHIFNFAPFTRL